MPAAILGSRLLWRGGTRGFGKDGVAPEWSLFQQTNTSLEGKCSKAPKHGFGICVLLSECSTPWGQPPPSCSAPHITAGAFGPGSPYFIF